MVTKELLLSLFDYDEKTGKLFWKIRPTTNVFIGDEAGRTHDHGYTLIKTIRLNTKKSFFRHHIIWFLENGEWPKILDHINGDTTDDRIQNLRQSTFRKNQQNRIEHRNGRLPGTFQTKSGRWRACASIPNRKLHHLGTFDTEKEAHEKYLQVLKEHNL